MKSRWFTILGTAAVIVALAAGSAWGVEYTHIWVDQESGTNSADTNGTPDDPFKSITYALARADYLGWAEPWHVHIGPGVYDANSVKPGPEREIFPIELGQAMIFEGADCDDPNNRDVDPNARIIDGQHLIQGLAALLLGQDVTQLEIRNLTFRNMNHSQGDGGAVELINCGGKIENCIVEDCSAKSGGGLWLSPHTPPLAFDIIACTFYGNSAASGSGGGLCVSGTVTGTISGCDFSDNSASNRGGGFYVNGSLTGNINECSFTDNSAGYYGGGFYVNGTLTGDITKSSFSRNSTIYYEGGGFYVNGSLTGSIHECSFTDNSAYSGGGFIVGGTLTGDIAGCSFSGNSAANYYGGGLYLNHFNGSISECSFSGNVANREGGGLFVYYTLTGNINGCTFTENAGNSGGIYIGSTLTGSIKDCEFDNGLSPVAGCAVHLTGTFDGVMESCQFFDFPESGVRLWANNATTAKIRSCLFVAPAALGNVSGWAINTKQKTIISNNTMVGPGVGVPAVPSQPSAVYVELDTEAENGEITNNIIVDTQCAIHVGPAVDMPIRYNCLNNINEIVCQGESCLGYDCWWLEQILSNFRDNHCDCNPQFVPADPMCHIERTSPCMDAGDPNYAAEAGDIDIDGETRVMGDCNEVLDIGADEVYFPNCWNCQCQCHGDGDCTDDVKGADFLALKDSWYSSYPAPNYDACADFDRNGEVKGSDFLILKQYWYQNPPTDCICCGEDAECSWPPI
jgi:hypothetical protein